MLTVTDTALDQIRSAALQGRAVGMALRLAARRGDDGSVDYGMGFDEPHDDDEQIAFDDLVVVVAAGASRTLLAGTTLDYVELEPGDFRFIFIPGPAEVKTAGSCSSGGCTRCGSGC